MDQERPDRSFPEFGCHLCGSTFSDQSSLDEHYSVMHHRKDCGYICPECNCGKVLQSEIIAHVRAHHPHFTDPTRIQPTRLDNSTFRTLSFCRGTNDDGTACDFTALLPEHLKTHVETFHCKRQKPARERNSRAGRRRSPSRNRHRSKSRRRQSPTTSRTSPTPSTHPSSDAVTPSMSETLRVSVPRDSRPNSPSQSTVRQVTAVPSTPAHAEARETLRRLAVSSGNSLHLDTTVAHYPCGLHSSGNRDVRVRETEWREMQVTMRSQSLDLIGRVVCANSRMSYSYFRIGFTLQPRPGFYRMVSIYSSHSQTIAIADNFDLEPQASEVNFEDFPLRAYIIDNSARVRSVAFEIAMEEPPRGIHYILHRRRDSIISDSPIYARILRSEFNGPPEWGERFDA